MARFLSFSLLLFASFLLEQTVLLPFGLSPGGFFAPFLLFAACISFLESDAKRWFIVCASAMAGLFSVTPLLSFLLFACGGASFLFVKQRVPVEGSFSFLAACWFGAASYFAALSVLWGSGWLFGFWEPFAVSSLRLFFARAVLFALWLLVPVSMVWGLAVSWRGNRQWYTLRS